MTIKAGSHSEIQFSLFWTDSEDSRDLGKCDLKMVGVPWKISLASETLASRGEDDCLNAAHTAPI